MRFLNPQEKIGGRPPNRIKMKTFNNFLYKANLLDLGFVGPRNTWTNCRQDRSIIRTQIDRAHANPNWLNIFPETKVIHLPRLNSDHCPILLNIDPSYNRGSKPFRFEPFWMSHNTFVPLKSTIW